MLHVQALPGNYHVPNKMVITWLNFISKQGSIQSSKKKGTPRSYTKGRRGTQWIISDLGNLPGKNKKGQCSRLSHSG